MRGHKIPADLLCKLYVVEGLSPRAIGARPGMGETAVRRLLQAAGIPLRTRSEAQQGRLVGLTCASLTQLYTQDGLSQTQIAARLRCSVDRVRAAMKRCRLATRSPSASARLARGVTIPEADLRHMDESEGLSTRLIAEQFGCSETVVRKRMNEYGVTARRPWASREVVIGAVRLYQFYVDEGLTLEVIAKKFNCSPATVSRQLRRCGITARPSGSPVYQRNDFSGDLIEKAYLIGFRLGDLAVFEEGASIIISTSTTKSDQIDLLNSLFDCYGPIYIFHHSSGTQYFHCSLNSTFGFLLPKADAVPPWVIRDDDLLAAFMAGYIDAEGSFQTAPRLSIRSYDANILRVFWERWSRWGIQCSGPRVVTKAGYMNKARMVSRRELWDLTVRRRASLECLIARLLPRMMHAKRRADVRRVLELLETKKRSKTKS